MQEQGCKKFQCLQTFQTASILQLEMTVGLGLYLNFGLGSGAKQHKLAPALQGAPGGMLDEVDACGRATRRGLFVK